MTDEPIEGGYGLVMPFVVCDDHGGPFDAVAFTAGWACAALDKTLDQLAQAFGTTGGMAQVEQYVDPRLIPQLDLIAMAHGFTVTHKNWGDGPDEWTLATFTRETFTDE